jgi:hypothetical protein
MFADDAKLKSLGAYLFWFGLVVGLISPFVLYVGIGNLGAGHGSSTVLNSAFWVFALASLLLFLSHIAGLVVRRRGNPGPWYWIAALMLAVVFSLPPVLQVAWKLGIFN